MPVGLRRAVFDNAGRVRGEEDSLVDERLGALCKNLEAGVCEGRRQCVQWAVGIGWWGRGLERLCGRLNGFGWRHCRDGSGREQWDVNQLIWRTDVLG